MSCLFPMHEFAEARENDCWVEGKCNNTRKYYRSRDKKLKSKQRSYAVATGKALPTEFEIVPDTHRAELVLYGNRPNKLGVVKGGVKGFQVLIYLGSNLVSQSNYVSCAGMIQADLESAIDSSLEQIDKLYGVKRPTGRLFGSCQKLNKIEIG